MRVLGLDPGTTQTGLALFDPVAGTIQGLHQDNEQVLQFLQMMAPLPDQLLILEGIKSYGRAVGQSVFQTCCWLGRFMETWDRPGGLWACYYQEQAKLWLTKSLKSKPSEINRSLQDRWGAKGTKKQPGRLYGFKGDHCFSALAIATYGLDCLEGRSPEPEDYFDQQCRRWPHARPTGNKSGGQATNKPSAGKG